MSELVNEILKDSDSKMDKAVEVARDDFGAIRTGRAHPSMFAKIMVDYYGTFTPLAQLASVQVPEARIAVVTPTTRVRWRLSKRRFVNQIWESIQHLMAASFE